MYSTSIASSSRIMIEPLRGGSSEASAFPTSDLRSAGLGALRNITPPTTPPSCSPTLPPMGSPIDGLSASSYTSAIPKRTQISPGVWSDGTDKVLSAACPEVQAFLACARDGMTLPAAPSELVFSLAALEVFYAVNDPVHWMFWSDEKKNHTAEVVSRISLHQPQLIRSRVAWNGTREYLFILSSLHGPTSLPLFESKHWYPILNPSKTQFTPRVLNLRKRKPQQVDPCELSGGIFDDESIDEEPLVKRTRTSRTSNGASSRVSKTVDRGSKPSRPEGVSPAVSSTSLPLEEMEVALQAARSPQEEPISKSLSIDAEQEGSQQRRKTAPRPSPQPSLSSASSSSRASSSGPTSILLTPPPSISHYRNRSTSQASSQTLVTARDRRSLSVLSAITAVEAPSIHKDDAPGAKQDEAMTDSEDGGDEQTESPSGMVTRGRASKARNPAAAVGHAKVVKSSTRVRARKGKGRAK